MATYLGAVLARAGGDLLTFVQLGDGFDGGLPVGELGYDGQFTYWIARHPSPAAVTPWLDVPAYRYQRILLPLLGRALALGQPALIPGALLLVNIVAHLLGTRAVERCLATLGANRWYALVYGLWAGLLLSVRLNLAEPLSYALLAAAMLAHWRGRLALSALALCAAIFAKETALLFAAALLARAVFARQPRAVLAYGLALLPYGLFQWLLARWFGAPGLGSGGYLATGFEWLPYMGLWRIALVSVPAFLLLGAIFGPLVLLPSVWGLVSAVRRLWRRDLAPAVWLLAANAAFIAITPFSTFREPLGLLRLAAGLVLAVLLFGAHTRSKRTLNYSLAWLSALVFLVKE